MGGGRVNPELFLWQIWHKWWPYGDVPQNDAPSQMLTPTGCIMPPDVVLGRNIDDAEA